MQKHIKSCYNFASADKHWWPLMYHQLSAMISAGDLRSGPSGLPRGMGDMILWLGDMIIMGDMSGWYDFMTGWYDWMIWFYDWVIWPGDMILWLGDMI